MSATCVAESPKPFAYKPLESSSHIRLLKIHQNKTSGSLPSSGAANRPDLSQYFFELIHNELSGVRDNKAVAIARTGPGRTDYIPISYTWGTQGRIKLLELRRPEDGCKCLGVISITPALLDTLPFLAEKALSLGVLYLWIDQICIDQENVAEREQQVALMGHLYGQANLALVWLGQEDEATACLRQHQQASPTPGGSSAITSTLGGQQPAPDSVRKAVLDLLLRPWFRRGWIIQEVALPRNIKF